MNQVEMCKKCSKRAFDINASVVLALVTIQMIQRYNKMEKLLHASVAAKSN